MFSVICDGVQEALDYLTSTNPAILGAGLLVSYIAADYAYDRLTDDEEEEENMNIHEAEAWLEGREEDLENPYDVKQEEEESEAEMSYEEAQAWLEGRKQE